MTTTKLFASIFLVLAVLFAQVGSVAAAPPAQETTISGTVTNIGKPETDENGVTTVLVTLDETQTVRISLDYAIQLGLIDQTTQQPVPLADLPATVTINSSEVIPDEEPTAPVHFISQLLADFFFPDDADAMASVIDSFHNGEFEVTNADGTETTTVDQVFGFGVIAQALWMSRNLNDGTADADLAGQILLAKQTGNYSAFSDYFEDGNIPSNWGQFKKALSEKKNSLGAAVSKQKSQDNSTDPLTEQEHGKGKHKGRGPHKK